VALALPADAADDALREKARRFREALVSRHVSPEGLVLYRLDSSRAGEIAAGDYPRLADTPTFNGLWAATACTRASVDPSPSGRREALRDAARALDGLEFLMRVTGRPGLLARGVRRRAEPAPDEWTGRWFAGAPPDAAYRWRGDVSVDQYANGLLPAVAACSPHLRERARALVTGFAAHLLEHGYRIVDPDGRPTRFGDLTWRSGAGFNSIAQLTAWGAMAWAAELDDDERWARERDRLRDALRIPARARTTNLRLLGVTNHSNDLMAFDLYRALLPLVRRTADPAGADLRHGLWRAWLRVRPDGNAYFAAVRCAVEPETCDRTSLVDAAQLLARFPLEKRKVASAPELADLPRRWLPGRKGKTLAREPVPIELRPPSSFEWKSSPYRVEGSARPEVAYTGLDYLAAYWMLVAADPEGSARRQAGAR
jgi:hypothetical protein